MSNGQCPTAAEAAKMGLLAPENDAVHTFSNGTEWECWASGNCFVCRRWDEDEAGKYCAFEFAALLHHVSPDLARLFGWPYDAEAEQKYGIRSAFDAPDECRFLLRRDNDEDREPPPPPPDPNQLVLIADPTEDAALLRHVSAPEHVHA